MKKNLVKIKNKKNLIWAGASDLFNRSESEQHRGKAKDSIVVVAKALNISPFGVNILGGLPYINNLGKKQKSLMHYHPNSNFEYNWVKRSETDDDKAICEVRIVQGKKVLTPWIVGECSPGSMKMSTLKGYQNHMAQTRSENRAMYYLDGLRVHSELLQRLSEMVKNNEVNKELALQAAQATTASAEEINEVEKIEKTVDTTPANMEDSKINAVIQGIYTKVKNLKTAKEWLDKAKKSSDLSKEAKSTIINLLETKIKLFLKDK